MDLRIFLISLATLAASHQNVEPDKQPAESRTKDTVSDSARLNRLLNSVDNLASDKKSRVGELEEGSSSTSETALTSTPVRSPASQ